MVDEIVGLTPMVGIKSQSKEADNDMKTWPNLFIVGAVRSGTTSLFAYLDNTQGIFMSPVKEPTYFISKVPVPLEGNSLSKLKDKTEYLKLFDGVTDEKIVGEATPYYLYDEKSPVLIHESSPQAKIIIILRDPVTRAFSHYLMRRRNGREDRDFHQVISAKDKQNIVLSWSNYSEYVKRYIEEFGQNQVKIIIFEEFIKEPRRIVKEVLEFLGVDSEPPENVGQTYNPYGEPRGNVAQKILKSNTIRRLVKRVPQNLKWKIKEDVLLKQVKKPKLSKEDESVLKSFYRSDAKKIQEIINKKIPWKCLQD